MNKNNLQKPNASSKTSDHFHDTYKLLKNYRDVIWSLELAVRQVKCNFEIEFGSSIESFLESIYVAGVDLNVRGIEQHARSIERSHKMLKLFDAAVDLLRTKHKFGEIYYWILYYTFLSPQQLSGTAEIIEKLDPFIRSNSIRTYYRRRNEAISALGSILWGYTAKEYLPIIDSFFPSKA